jgi:hypothetical protein
MALKRSDYDQAARYLKRVSELMERDAKALTRILRELLAMAVKRLSSGETAVGDAIAEIALLRAGASDAGLRQRQTKALYPNHRSSPWFIEDATRDRSIVRRRT